MKPYDLIILGGGPAGYIAAERAGARGASVLLLEERDIGGTCLNEGCIPTKSLLYGAKLYHQARESARFGVTAENVRFDLAAAVEHKNKTIKTLQKGILAQLKHGDVQIRSSRGTLVRPGIVEAEDEQLQGKNILIATGSDTARPPIPGAKENPRVLTSREILDVTTPPKKLVVIGGGYIGMEFASFFAAIGTDVTVVEMMPEIIPMLEPEVAQNLRRHLSDVTYKLGYRVEKIEGSLVHIAPAGDAGSGAETLEADTILLSTGRVPRVSGSGLVEAGIGLTGSAVAVDEYMRTNQPGVYAAGDVTGRMLLAHAAYRMGEVAVSHMFRETAVPGVGSYRMRYRAIPWVVFTAPEVAGCGFNPREARAAGYPVATATLPLQVSGRYLAEHPREKGTVTIVADERDGRLLGVQMLGSGVGEIIHSAAAMIEAELHVQDIREIVFPHPTVSEALRDAAWALKL